MGIEEQAWQLIGSGQHPSAIALLRRQLAEQPTDASALRILGEAHLQQGEFADAEDAMRKALDIESHFVAHYGLGLLSHLRLDFSDASRRYAAALECGVPDTLEACENIVLAFAASGQNKGATAVAEGIAKVHPEYGEGLHTLAHAVRGYDPKGGLLGGVARAIHVGLPPQERAELEAARAFVRTNGKRPSRLFGGLRRIFGG